MDPYSRAAWTNVRVLVTLLLVFLSGAVVGALTLSAMRSSSQAAEQARTINWDKAGANLCGDLTKELDLNDDQQKQLKQILDDFFLYYHELEDQMDEVRAAGKVKIMEILTVEQKQRFHVWLAKQTTQ